MISGVRAFACSGALGGTASSKAEPPFEIFEYNSAWLATPNRVGFMGQSFGPVIVGVFQERTIRTDNAGTNYGQLINNKFTGASTSEVSGVSFPNLTNLPGISGSVLWRFRESSNTAVQTQNGFLRVVRFTSDIPVNGLKPLNIDIRAYKVQDTHGNAGGTSWTQLSDGLGGGSDLSLSNHTSPVTVHDFPVAISASPQAVGTNTAFGFLIQLEYL